MIKSNFKSILCAALVAAVFTGCTKDDDYKTQALVPYVFTEDFTTDIIDNTVLNTPGWTNFAEAGSKKWTEQIYSGNAYAEFSGYQSGDTSNIGWLISPGINMDAHENEKLQFLSAQAYVDSASANPLEVLISEDFDGTNVLAASWTPISFTQPTFGYDYRFTFYKSGEIDLSSYTGNIHVAFRVKGGTGGTVDGTYQIDNIRVTY